jgi:hypothetical protein
MLASPNVFGTVHARGREGPSQNHGSDPPSVPSFRKPLSVVASPDWEGLNLNNSVLARRNDSIPRTLVGETVPGIRYHVRLDLSNAVPLHRFIVPLVRRPSYTYCRVYHCDLTRLYSLVIARSMPCGGQAGRLSKKTLRKSLLRLGIIVGIAVGIIMP